MPDRRFVPTVLIALVVLSLSVLTLGQCKSDNTNNNGNNTNNNNNNTNNDAAVQMDSATPDGGINDGGTDAMIGDASVCATSLSTQTLNQLNQGLDGIMFDVVAAAEDVTITGIDSHLIFGTHDVTVYHAVGSHASIVESPGSWTVDATATGVVSNGGGMLTPIPMSLNIVVPAGQTYSLYITTSNDNPGDGFGVGFSPGTTFGGIASQNNDLQILEGQGVTYPFTQTPSTPRIWDGVIHYTTPGTCQ